MQLCVVGLLSAIFAMAACNVEGADSELLVDIPDANLRWGIERALWKEPGEPITRGEMASVSLIGAKNVVDLTGIGYAVNLASLTIRGSYRGTSAFEGDISDLLPLAGLVSLTYLDLDGNEISDLSPLAGLVSLTYLALTTNEVVDLSPLAGLVSLTDLDLRSNEISDLSPLADLVSLTRLWLGDNEVSDLSPLAGLESLTRLDLYQNYILEAEPLVRNPGFGDGDHIDLRDNWLSERSLDMDIPALRQRGVETLVDNRHSACALLDDALPGGWCSTFSEGESPVEIADRGLRTAIRRSSGAPGVWPLHVDEIAKMGAIRGRSENIVELSGIELATGVQFLDLSGNAITDIAPLGSLPTLRFLHLDDNNIEDIAPLAGFVENAASRRYRLSVLTLRNNMIEDIGALAGLGRDLEVDALGYLALDGNKISDLSPLPKLLRRLYLTDNAISDIAALSDQVDLWELRLSGNAITSIAPLAEMRYLRHLHFSNNKVEDLAPLTNLPHLDELHMRNNSVQDLSPLLGKKLWMVDVRGNPLPCDSVTALRRLREDGATVLAGEVVPFFAATSADREGFVRLINRSDADGEVCIEAVDDAGVRHGPVRLDMGARWAVHLSSADLENGDAAKGIINGIGRPTVGDWRLEVVSSLDVEVLSYVRTEDGFLTTMHDVATEETLPFFNPGSNEKQRSILRVVNTEAVPGKWMTGGYDDHGTWHPMANAVVLRPGHALTLTVAELEGTHGLGDGHGKWRLRARGFPWYAMSLLANPGGHLTNLSSVPDNAELLADGTNRHGVPLLLATDPSRPSREGFLRVVNRSNASGQVAIHAIDDLGDRVGPIYLDVQPRRTVHVASSDLEAGNAAKGLSGGVGRGEGDWRLTLTSELDIQVLSYVHTEGGFVASMHDLAPRSDDGVYRVVFFNPGSNTEQVSKLRLINNSDQPARVTVTGIDDEGEGSGTVALTVPALSARTFTAAELETGGERVSGGLGDGSGKWRLRVDADVPVAVMSLLESPTGLLANVSTGTAD